MGKMSLTKSSQSNTKRSSSTDTLSKSLIKTHSHWKVKQNSLQTYPHTVSSIQNRHNQTAKTIESVRISRTTLMKHIIKNVQVQLVDLVHTDLLTQEHRDQLHKLTERNRGLTFSICSSYDSDISGSSFRVNDRELRSLPVRNERVKRESTFLKYIHETSGSFRDCDSFHDDGNVSIVDKFYKKGNAGGVGRSNDEEKKWRFWNGNLSSEGSSYHGSVTSSVRIRDSSDILSTDESEIGRKRKRRKKPKKKLLSPSKKSPSGKKRGRKPKMPPLEEELPATLTAAQQVPQTSTSPGDPVAKKKSRIQPIQLSAKNALSSDTRNHEPNITMRRTVVTWSGNRQTTWILNVMPKSEAVRTGKMEKIKKARLLRNPLNQLKSVDATRKRRSCKKRTKEGGNEDDKTRTKVKVEVLLKDQLLCCDGPCKCKPEDDLVVYKLPSMPAIDGAEAVKQIKSDLSGDSQPKSSPRQVTSKREISSVVRDVSNNLVNSGRPPKLRKLNDGKKYPEIINDTLLPAATAITFNSPLTESLKTIGRIPKIDSSNNKVSPEKLKITIDNSSKLPEPASLISPTVSVTGDNNKATGEMTTPTSTKSRKSKIVYDFKDNENKPAPLTIQNVELFSKMINNQQRNDVEVGRTECRRKLRISRFSTRDNDSNNNNSTNNNNNNNNGEIDEKKSKKGRRDWKKESSQVNDGSNSSSESSPLVNKFMQYNSDDSLPRFGQILAPASTADTPIERRVFEWIHKDLDISDDKNFKDLDLSDNSLSASSEALKIDEKDLSCVITNMNDSKMTVDNQSTIEGKSVNENTLNLDDTRQSVTGEDDKFNSEIEGLIETQKNDDTLSISSSSSSDSNKSSDSSSSSSSASSQSSLSSSISSNNINISEPLKIVVESEKSPNRVKEFNDCVNDKPEEADNRNELEILRNDKCDDDRGYVSIVEDNNSINNSNDKSINEEEFKVDDKSNASSGEEKRLEVNEEENSKTGEDNRNIDGKRLEIDSVIDDNDNIEKNQLIESEPNCASENLKEIQEEEEDDNDTDAISLYAESLSDDKPDQSSASPESLTFGALAKPPSPRDDYDRMESNTFNNYYQLTEREFDNDYQNVNIQTNYKGLTTRRFRDRLNNQNNNQGSNDGHLECDSSYARSPNSHTINDNNVEQFNTYSIHQLDSNYNIVKNKKLQQSYEQHFTKQRNVFDPEVKKLNPSKDYVKQFFYGNCFQHLKTGNCTKVDKCRHNHTISSKLQHIYLDSPERIHVTLIYAFEQNFHFYLRDVYYKSIVRLDVAKILEFFRIVLFSNISKRELVPDYIKWTIDALLAKNRTLKSIVNVLNERLVQMGNMIKPVMSPGEVCNTVISHLATKITIGCYWETFRSLILNQVSLSPVIVSYVLQESIECNKPYAHLKDINTFLIPCLDEYHFNGINGELYHKFMSLLDEQMKKEQTMFMENVVEIRQKPPEAISLASPDTIDIIHLPNNANSFISSANVNKYIPERDLIPFQSSNDKVNSNNDHFKTKFVINSIDNRLSIEERVENQQYVVPSTSRAGGLQEATQTLFANKYQLIPIDALKPQSVYESHVWLLRSDLENIQTAIRKNDYDEIIKVLNINKRSQSQPFVRGFYTILCKEIMESVRHLNEIIQRTVKAGLYVKLHQLLTDTGIMLLTTLTDNNYWVLAYHLLKSLNSYLINADDYTVEFVYISVEIYIANHKPLKAIDLIRRNNMILGHVEQWKVKPTNVKKALKVHGNLLRILFKALAYFSPAYAVELCRKVIGDQTSAFYPINLTHVITDIINTVLTDIINTDINNIENIEHTLTELSKVILSHNVIVYDKLLRNIIVEVYHIDVKLSRQLFKYATCIGIYTTVKYYDVNSAATLTIDTNLSEEEMHLLLAESLESLKEQIGCNIYMLQPRQLSFYLNLEIIPDKKMLYRDNISLKNNVQIIKGTKAVLARVFEKFTPKLRMFSKTVAQRLCRISSYTVFPHLIKNDD